MMLESALGRTRKQRTKRALARQLRDHGVFSPTHAVDVALDICGALAIAHANGIVHGQLGLHCVRLVFGHDTGPSDVEIFALVADADESGVAVAAAPFLAPEQRDFSAPIDVRADVWAVGALLYTMLVGIAPPAGTSDTISVPEGSIAPTLAAIVEACLAVAPDARPQTIDFLAERLASFASSPPDRFAFLAQRRTAAQQRKQLELRGLADMPGVLDRLDDAAVTRALDEAKTAKISSLLHPAPATTEKAMERLMVAVHQGTDEGRLELASALPALVDFDDEDDEFQPTRVRDESDAVLVSSPLAHPPASIAALATFAQPAAEPAAPPVTPRRWSGALIALLIATAALAAFAAVFGVQVFTARRAEAPARVFSPPPLPSPATSAPPVVAAPKSTIPTFTVSALPDAKR